MLIRFDGTITLNGGVKTLFSSAGQDIGLSLPDWSSSATITEERLVAFDGSNNDRFGNSIAISSDGNTMIVGAVYADAVATDSGAAYVYTRSGNTWQIEQKLTSNDNVIGNEYLGWSVDISADGNTAIVGSTIHNSHGAAYVYTRSGSTWQLEHKLVSSDITLGDLFGGSVALSGDGNIAVVSAKYDDDTIDRSGSVYIFVRSNGVWTQEQKIVAYNPVERGDFGHSLNISSDGSTLVITRYGLNSSDRIGYIYTKTGSTYAFQQLLMPPSDINGPSSNGISLSSDGSIVAVGNSSYDNGPGAVSVYTRSGSAWNEQQLIINPDSNNGERFGYSVALTSVGNILVIGSFGFNNDFGAVYVYAMSEGVWSIQRRITISHGQESDGFGYSVGITSDGSMITASAPTEAAIIENIVFNSQEGAVYTFITE